MSSLCFFAIRPYHLMNELELKEQRGAGTIKAHIVAYACLAFLNKRREHRRGR